VCTARCTVLTFIFWLFFFALAYQVYKGCFKVSGAKVAIKQLFELMIEPDEVAVKHFLREASTLASLHHPHIVHQFGVSIDPTKNQVYIVMELCEKSLHKVITAGPSEKLDLAEKLRMLTHIVEGMIFLHSRNIVHR
jgi:serine/threonine protein kinase